MAAGCARAKSPHPASITTSIRSIISTSARRPGSRTWSSAERVTYITPRYEFGQAHHDGTALVLGRDLEETRRQHRALSRKDAATFREWNRRAEEITAQILLPERYSEPLPQAEREALLSRTALGREFLAVTRRQPLDVVQELFENEHVELLFLFKVSLFGTWLVDTLSKTSPMGSGDPRLRPGERLPALPGRLVQPGARPDGDVHRRRRHVPAAGRYRPHRDREGGRATGIALERRPNRAGQAIRGFDARRASRRSRS